MRRRVLVPTVVVAALVAGGASAWAWDARVAALAAGRDHVAAAVAAGRHDERQTSRLAVRSADLVGQDLLDDARDALADLLPPAVAALAASEGQVADEAVRQRLAAAVDAARTGLDDALAPASSGALGDELAAATAAVTAAHDEWLAAQAALAAREAEQTKAEQEAALRASLQPDGVPGTEPPGGCSVPASEPFYPSVPRADGDGSNGNLPRSAMAPLPWPDTHGNELWLVTEATAQLTALDEQFSAVFGHHIDVDITYRDYCTQAAMEQYYGYPRAARAGTSNHGWGRAIDIWEWPDKYGYGTPMHTWLAENGPAFGWYEQPPGGEYWHFDYRG